MSKQFKILAFILVAFFIIYSLYYYSNYKVKGLEIIKDVDSLKETVISNNLDIFPGKKNILYSPAYEIANSKDRGNDSLLITNVSANNSGMATYNGPVSHSEKELSEMVEKRLNTRFSEVIDTSKKGNIVYAYTFFEFIPEHIFRFTNESLVWNGIDVKTMSGQVFHGSGIEIFHESGEYLVKIVNQYQQELNLAFIRRDSTLLEMFKKAELLKKIEPATSGYSIKLPLFDFSIIKEHDLPNNYIMAREKISFELNTVFNIFFSQNKKKGLKEINFDKPFLLYVKDKDATWPSLVLWVANSEILLERD